MYKVYLFSIYPWCVRSGTRSIAFEVVTWHRKAAASHETARRGWFMAKSLNWMLVFHGKNYFLDQSGARKFVWSIFWIGCIFNCSFTKTILSHTAMIKLFYTLILRMLKDIDPARLVDPYLLLLNAFQNDQSRWVWWHDSQVVFNKRWVIVIPPSPQFPEGYDVVPCHYGKRGNWELAWSCFCWECIWNALHHICALHVTFLNWKATSKRTVTANSGVGYTVRLWKNSATTSLDVM